MADDTSLQHHRISYKAIGTYHKSSTICIGAYEYSRVHSWEQTESSTAYNARVELKLILAKYCDGTGVLKSKLNDNGPFSPSIMRYVVAKHLGFCLNSEEINHAFDQNSWVRGVRRSWGYCRRLSGVEQLSNVESDLLKSVIEESHWNISLVEQKSTGSDVVGVLGVVELKSQAILLIVKEEVKMREGAFFYPDLWMNQWVVCINHILSTPIPLPWVSVLQESLKSNQVVRGRGEVYLLFLNVPDHSSRARNVVELSLSHCNIRSNGRHLDDIIISAKVMLELTAIND